MTKQQLIEHLAESEGISKQIAILVIEIIFRSMAETLAQGGNVEIRGFGSFKVKKYKGYKGRNPKTGAFVKIKPKKLPIFKAGKDLRERVNK